MWRCGAMRMLGWRRAMTPSLSSHRLRGAFSDNHQPGVARYRSLTQGFYFPGTPPTCKSPARRAGRRIAPGGAQRHPGCRFRSYRPPQGPRRGARIIWTAVIRNILGELWCASLQIPLRRATFGSSWKRPGFGEMRLSPDGSRVAVSIRVASLLDPWIYDVVRGRGIRLTRGTEAESPVWAPNGTRLAVGIASSIAVLSADATGAPERLVERDKRVLPTTATVTSSSCPSPAVRSSRC
jgi:hypothetical protein